MTGKWLRIFMDPVVESKSLDKWPVLNKSTPNLKLGILNNSISALLASRSLSGDLWILDSCFRILDLGLWSVNCELWIMNCELWLMIMIDDYDWWLWLMIMIDDYDLWLWFMIMIYGLWFSAGIRLRGGPGAKWGWVGCGGAPCRCRGGTRNAAAGWEIINHNTESTIIVITPNHQS